MKNYRKVTIAILYTLTELSSVASFVNISHISLKNGDPIRFSMLDCFAAPLNINHKTEQAELLTGFLGKGMGLVVSYLWAVAMLIAGVLLLLSCVEKDKTQSVRYLRWANLALFAVNVIVPTIFEQIQKTDRMFRVSISPLIYVMGVINLGIAVYCRLFSTDPVPEDVT